MDPTRNETTTSSSTVSRTTRPVHLPSRRTAGRAGTAIQAVASRAGRETGTGDQPPGDRFVFVIDVLAGFVGAFLLFGPAIYAGVELLPDEESVEYPVAAATALVGLPVAGLVDGLLGWLPLVGVVLSPLAWSVVVNRFGRASWPASLAVGFATWALSVLFYAGIAGL